MKRKGNRYSHKAKIEYVIYNGTNASAVFSLIRDYVKGALSEFTSLEFITFENSDGEKQYVYSGEYVCIDHFKQIIVCDEQDFLEHTVA